MLPERLGREEPFLRPPEHITAPHPFIAIGDIDVVVNRVVPGSKDDRKISSFQQQLLRYQREYGPKECTYYYVSHAELLAEIEARIARHLTQTDMATGVVNFDRYILEGSTDPHIIRLELSRGANNELVPRPGTAFTREEQVEQLRSWLTKGGYSRVLLTDDVIAFATTFPPIIEVIREALPDSQLTAISGICSSQGTWSGKEKLVALGVDVESVITAVASPAPEGSTKGMAIPDSRDMTVFGGKIGQTLDGARVSFPYFYPFSKPFDSVLRPEVHTLASEALLQFNIDLVSHVDRLLERPLTMRDLRGAGFGIPHTSVDEFKDALEPPNDDTDVSSYLSHVQSLFSDLMKRIVKT